MDVEKLIERLRKNADFIECSIGGNRHADLYRDAADTIEHLKSENAQLRGDLVVAKKLIEAERKPPADLFAELSDDDKRKAEILAMRDMVAIKDKEIARMTAERDAAISDLKISSYCKTCANRCGVSVMLSKHGNGACKDYQWRGLKEEDCNDA